MEGCSLDAFALNWDGWTSVSSEITFGIFWIPIWAWKMIPCELFVQSLLNCFFAMQSVERLRLVSVVEKSKRFCIVCRPRGLLDAHAAVLLEFYFGLCLSWTLIWWREKNYDSISAYPFYSISASPLSIHKTRTFLLGWCWMIFNNWFRRKQALGISVTKFSWFIVALSLGLEISLKKLIVLTIASSHFVLHLYPLSLWNLELVNG